VRYTKNPKLIFPTVSAMLDCRLPLLKVLRFSHLAPGSENVPSKLPQALSDSLEASAKVEGEPDEEEEESGREPQWAMRQRTEVDRVKKETALLLLFLTARSSHKAASTSSWSLPLLTGSHEPASVPQQPPSVAEWQSYPLPDYASLFST
jgi:hypothetical protein